MTQGELAPGTLKREAAGWGRELKQAGVNLDLAPVMDVVPPGTAAQNQPIGALRREFGSDPQTVATHGVAFLRGLRQAGVAATAKHFPGLGRVTGNTDLTAGVVDPVTAPGDPYLGSFQAAVDAGVPFVMVSLASYPRIDPRHLAVFSSRTMRTLLRNADALRRRDHLRRHGRGRGGGEPVPGRPRHRLPERRRGHDPLGEPARGRRHGHRGARPR